MDLQASRQALREALRRHAPSDDAERRDRDAMLALLDGAGDPFSRAHFAPGHVTASAFVVCRATRQVLLHHHRRLRAWLQLGGHDDGERDPLATALREAREESGLDDLLPLSPGILDLDVHPIPAGKGEPDHFHFDVRYALETRTPEAIARQEAESLDLAWLTLAEAERRMNEPGGTRALEKLRRLLEQAG